MDRLWDSGPLGTTPPPPPLYSGARQIHMFLFVVTLPLFVVVLHPFVVSGQHFESVVSF